MLAESDNEECRGEIAKEDSMEEDKEEDGVRERVTKPDSTDQSFFGSGTLSYELAIPDVSFHMTAILRAHV